MSERPLHVLFTPSVREGPWAQVIREAAEAKGLTVAYLGEGDADVVLAHHLSIEKVRQVDPRDWVILADTPGAALVSYGDAYKEYPPAAQSLTASAARLAAASWLAERGAPVLGQPAMALSLPRLGLVSGPPLVIPPDPPGPLEPALGLYERLPVRVGARATLPPQSFSFPFWGRAYGGPSRVDLTGRDRLLMDGPYMLLPPGVWQATLKLAIDPQGRDVPLAFDWGEAHDMVSVEETIQEAGFYSICMEHLFESAGMALMRISLTQPLFQGVLEVIECVVERMPDPEPKLPLEA